MTPYEMIDEFMCPGCTCGSAPCKECSSFEFAQEDGFTGGFFSCKNWSAGTFLSGAGKIALGLPKGFCRLGFTDQSKQTTWLRLYNTMPEWDKFNVAVWAMIKDNVLYVRTYCPRVNLTFVDVISGCAILHIPTGAIDVGKFIDDID